MTTWVSKSKKKVVLLIVSTFLVYSLSGVFSKFASQYAFLSFGFALSFIGVISALGIYAIFWQRVLCVMELNKAFLMKSVSILFTLFFSFFIFDETITVKNIIGSAFIMFGLGVLAWKR